MEARKRSPFFLYFAVFAINLTLFSTGTTVSWSSSSLPILAGQFGPESNPIAPHTIDFTEESLIASLIAIGGIFSSYPAAKAADYLGRKRALLLSTIPMFLHYVIIYFSTTVWSFCLARFIAGLSSGAFFVIVPTYVVEFAETHNRGALSCILGTNLTLGMLLFYVIGPYVSIQTTSLIGMISPLLVFIIVGLYVPESSHYLLLKQEDARAKKALNKIRTATSVELRKELLEISFGLKDSEEDVLSIADLFKGTMLRTTIMVSGIMVYKELCGLAAVLFYLYTIFEATGSNISSEFSSMFIGLIQVVSSIVTPLFIDKFGRRFFLFLSAVGTTITLFFIGLFFYIKETGGDTSSIGFVPLVSLVIYILTSNTGFGAVSFAILGEVYANNAKASASTLGSVLTFVPVSVLSFSFPYIVKFLGSAVCFWLFSVICFSSIFFIYFTVPETKGKTLKEIQEILKQ